MWFWWKESIQGNFAGEIGHEAVAVILDLTYDFEIIRRWDNFLRYGEGWSRFNEWGWHTEGTGATGRGTKNSLGDILSIGVFRGDWGAGKVWLSFQKSFKGSVMAELERSERMASSFEFIEGDFLRGSWAGAKGMLVIIFWKEADIFLRASEWLSNVG